MRKRVDLLVATSQKLDFRLEIGQMAQSVIVSEAAPTLNTQDATVGNPFGEKEVKELPFLARNVINLLTLQRGVVFTGNSDTDRLAQGDIGTLDGREGAVNGVRGNQTNVTLDGVDANDWQNQAAFTSALPVTLDSVQEFRVTTANANSTDGVAYRELRKRGIAAQEAAQTAGSSDGPWHLANTPALKIALPNAFFASFGLPELTVHG